jgi:hypothetical protein
MQKRHFAEGGRPPWLVRNGAVIAYAALALLFLLPPLCPPGMLTYADVC